MLHIEMHATPVLVKCYIVEPTNILICITPEIYMCSEMCTAYWCFILVPCRKLWLTIVTCCIFGAGAAFAIVPVYSDMYENTK